MVTLRDLVIIHFRDLKTRLRSSSYNTYTVRMLNMLMKHEGMLSKEINLITRDDIIYLKEECLKSYHQNSVKRVVSLVKKIFRQSLELGYINNNIADSIEDIIFKKYKVTNIITKEQFNLLLQDIQKNTKIDKTDQILYLNLLFYTGIRSGEARALTWKDINFKNSTLTINKSVYSLTHGIFTIFPTKTNSSNRIIHLPKSLLEDLKIFKEITQYNDESDFVFSYDKGIPQTHGYNKSTLKKSAARLGLNISHHGLRHSHATILVQNEIDINLVKNRLGHSNISTTLEIYSHVQVYNEDSIIKLLDNI